MFFQDVTSGAREPEEEAPLLPDGPSSQKGNTSSYHPDPRLALVTAL
jgi:hypothetical protein